MRLATADPTSNFDRTIELDEPLLLWLNDGLMTVFFFVVGLEIKWEFVAGELRDRRKAVAALGGMIVPAGIYLLFQIGRPSCRVGTRSRAHRHV